MYLFKTEFQYISIKIFSEQMKLIHLSSELKPYYT